MKILLLAFLYALWPLLEGTARANTCGLSQGNAAAGAILASPTHTLVLSMVSAGGISQSTGATLGLGPQFISRAAFGCFMATDMSLMITAYPGSKSTRRNVPSAAPMMNLEWTTTIASLPLTYQVFVGTSPFHPSTVVNGLTATNYVVGGISGLGPASYEVANLSYMTPYYWRVVGSDEFGRTAGSPIYSFSIMPVVDHMIAAPNPFQPGTNTTTLMFSMPGSGSAIFEVFSLPDSRLLIKTNIEGLTDGVNTYTYDGRDSSGRLLPNGVYVVRLRKTGAKGNATETFKLVSAR